MGLSHQDLLPSMLKDILSDTLRFPEEKVKAAISLSMLITFLLKHII